MDRRLRLRQNKVGDDRTAERQAATGRCRALTVLGLIGGIIRRIGIRRFRTASAPLRAIAAAGRSQIALGVGLDRRRLIGCDADAGTAGYLSGTSCCVGSDGDRRECAAAYIVQNEVEADRFNSAAELSVDAEPSSPAFHRTGSVVFVYCESVARLTELPAAGVLDVP